MAIRNIAVCDWCKKEEEVVNWYGENNWKSIEIKFTQYNEKKLDLCPDCLKKLGLVNEKGKAKVISEPTTYEKLLEVVADIVAESQG